MVRTLPIETVRPSQFYLSSQKLATVLDWFDFFLSITPTPTSQLFASEASSALLALISSDSATASREKRTFLQY